MTLSVLSGRVANMYPYAFGLIWPLLIIVAVVLLASAMRRGSGRPHPPPSGSRSGPAALDILEQRYARGEIDRDEFLERRAVLTASHPTGGAWPSTPPPPPPPPPSSRPPSPPPSSGQPPPAPQQPPPTAP